MLVRDNMKHGNESPWWRHQMEIFSGLSTGHRWIPLTKASDAELWFFFICAWTNDWANNGDAGDLRRHRAHYDVTVVLCVSLKFPPPPISGLPIPVSGVSSYLLCDTGTGTIGSCRLQGEHRLARSGNVVVTLWRKMVYTYIFWWFFLHMMVRVS